MSDPIARPTDPRVRGFAAFLAELDDGQLLPMASAELEALLAALRSHAVGGNGTARGKLNLAISFAINGSTVDISAELSCTKPKPKTGRSVFWLTEASELSRRNPNQGDFFLRDATTPAAEIRDAGA